MPPQLADKLLKVFLPEDLAEELQGDMQEQFERQVEEIGETKARILYAWEALKFCRPYFLKRRLLAKNNSDNAYYFLINPHMIRNYLKIAWRNFAKNKTYSAINISGLAIGMAVTILIGIWMQDELSANKHHANYNSLYKIMSHQTYSDVRSTMEASPLPMIDALRQNYPDFQAVAICDWGAERVLSIGDKKIQKQGSLISKEAIDMFSFNIMKGDKNPLKEPNAIVLTDETAQDLFGDQDPIGKIVKVDNKIDVKVAAVVAKQPANASFQFDYLMPWELIKTFNPDVITFTKDHWDYNVFVIYAQLKNGVDPAKVNAKIKDEMLSHAEANSLVRTSVKPEVFIHPMSDWRLYSDFANGKNTGGFIRYVILFAIIGSFILVIACINFMNLSTARSEKRAKEVGIRKVMGSLRKQLIGQFLSESLLLAFFALTIALIISYISLPYFNSLTQKTMQLPWTNPTFWGIALLFTCLTGLLAGSYPALYLSSFNPIRILKGIVYIGKNASMPRKVLVVIQFSFSIVLIIATVVIYQQIEHGKNRPIGFTSEGLISVNASADLIKNFEPLRQELISKGLALSMAKTNSPPTQIWGDRVGWEWKNSTEADKGVPFNRIETNFDYAQTLGIKLLEGRDFSRQFSSDSSGVILNEAAVKRMNLKNPLGELLKFEGKPLRVIGVIADMQMGSPFQAIAPLTIVFDKETNFINIRINPTLSASEAITQIGDVLGKYNPAFPFEYQFADVEYAKKFSYEQLIGNLTLLIASLAIFISCLGLFGLTSFIAEQRTKEIGVRKVLGASITSLWGLLSKDFILLVLIAFLIATPTAWYFLSDWLKNYPYRISLSWWVFAITGLGALLIALMTVSFQTIKAALVNPVKSLKSE
ncbi:ABC transporter permease [Emticicia fontis]